MEIIWKKTDEYSGLFCGYIFEFPENDVIINAPEPGRKARFLMRNFAVESCPPAGGRGELHRRMGCTFFADCASSQSGA
ncbi:MAG TPA: hypothetical protein DCS59_06650 [Eubacterium sp.]|nr:hypothetical protein [Eubacterium sp.]